MQHVEVDFLPVGNGERSADAIAVRYGDFNDPENQFVLVIDGGTKEAGENLVRHIRQYYHRDQVVDLVVLTHPDADHSSGLTVVLEEMQVRCLLMHRPWLYSEELSAAFVDGRVTDKSIKERLRRSLENVKNLEVIAKRKGIPIYDPFTDLNDALQAYTPHLTILGPSREFYLEQLPGFRGVVSATAPGLLQRLASGLGDVVGKVAETIGIETLADPADDATSAENNTSVVLHLDVDGYQWVFTGDAGVPALTEAADYADNNALDLQSVRRIQVPHHGSRRNVGPTILDRIIGAKRVDDEHPKRAAVSASRGDSKHPSRKVCNAFYRRGARVVSTEKLSGCLLLAAPGTPTRPGFTPVEPLPFFDEVEEDESKGIQEWSENSTYMPTGRDSARRY